jgi:ATP-dependent Lon protease
MVFVGNINQSVESLVKTSHLLAPFPEAMIDSAFFDRFHAYVPGWEIPKMRPEFFTNQYGLIVDYLAEYLREMRKYNFADAIDKWFKLGNNLNQRDTIAVRRTVSGLLKLICPAGDYQGHRPQVPGVRAGNAPPREGAAQEDRRHGVLRRPFFLHRSGRRQERFISVPEQSGGALMPDGRLQPGTLHTISMGTAEMPGIFRLEIQSIAGGGKISASGAAPKEPVRWRSITSRPTRHGSVHRSSRASTIFTCTWSNCRMLRRHRR